MDNYTIDAMKELGFQPNTKMSTQDNILVNWTAEVRRQHDLATYRALMCSACNRLSTPALELHESMCPVLHVSLAR